MNDRPVALIQVPSKALFRPSDAALYLGMHVQTLKALTDEGLIAAKWDPRMGRRMYLWQELERYKNSLPEYNPDHGENPRLEGKTNGSL